LKVIFLLGFIEMPTKESPYNFFIHFSSSILYYITACGLFWWALDSIWECSTHTHTKQNRCGTLMETCIISCWPALVYSTL